MFSFTNDFKNTALKSLVREGKKVMQKVVWCRRDKFSLCLSISILCARYLASNKSISLETLKYVSYLNLISGNRAKGLTDLLVFLDNW